MKALVIGGNRFFGRHLVSLLLKDGTKVTILNRGKHPDPFGTTVERIRCDRRDPEKLFQAIKGKTFDVVFDQVCYDAYDARAACKVFEGITPLYVFTSSMSVYPTGPSIVERAYDPKANRIMKAVEVTQNPGEAKRQAESVFFTDAKFRVIAARFPIVCGLDDYTSRLEFHVVGVDCGELMRFPNFDARMGFVDSYEAAQMLQFLSQSSFSGPINCSSSDAIAMRDLIGWIEHASGKKAKIITGLDGGELSPFGIASDWFGSVKLLESLGYKTRSLQEWLPKLIHELVMKRRKQKTQQAQV